MHNFLKHRFQIDLDQSVRNSSEYPVGKEVYYNKLLTESKKEIVENCEQKYNAKLEKEKERNRQYRSDLDKLTNQVNEYETIIENKNEEIKTCTSKIILLEKENEIIEQEYISKLNNLINQVKEYTSLIEYKNEEIKANTSKIINLEKENKNLKVKLNALIEDANYYPDKFFDVYHLKTWLMISLINILKYFLNLIIS